MNPKRLEEIEERILELDEPLLHELAREYRELQIRYLMAVGLVEEKSKLLWQAQANEELLEAQLRAEEFHSGEGDCAVCTHLVLQQTDKALGEALDREAALEIEIERLRAKLAEN